MNILHCWWYFNRGKLICNRFQPEFKLELTYDYEHGNFFKITSLFLLDLQFFCSSLKYLTMSERSTSFLLKIMIWTLYWLWLQHIAQVYFLFLLTAFVQSLEIPKNYCKINFSLSWSYDMNFLFDHGYDMLATLQRL